MYILLFILIAIIIIDSLNGIQTEHMVDTQCANMIQDCCNSAPGMNKYPYCNYDLLRSLCGSNICSWIEGVE